MSKAKVTKATTDYYFSKVTLVLSNGDILLIGRDADGDYSIESGDGNSAIFVGNGGREDAYNLWEALGALLGEDDR